MNTWADDLSTLIEHLDLKQITLMGHSTGGGEIARYIGRHGTSRVAKVILVSANPPIMMQTATNPEGTPPHVFDDFRAAMHADRAKFFTDVPTGPFFGFNRDNSTKSQGLINAWFQAGMIASFPAVYECTRTWQEDYTEDLKKIGGDIPVLVVVGDDDQIVPWKASSKKVPDVVRQARLVVYEGAPHALPDTHKDRLNEDVLKFLRE
jgi:non-heme chloroperoxidase